MIRKKYLSAALIASLLLWLLHAILLVSFTPGTTFMEMFITSVPLSAFVFRIVFVVVIFLLSFYLGRGHATTGTATESIEIEIPEGIRELADNDPDFLSNFLHKVRVQLNNIFGFADLLRDKSTEKDEAERYFGYIESSKQSVNAAIDELLSVLKMGEIKTWRKGDDYLEIIDWKGKKILVAEDVETNYILLRAVLEKTGAEILWSKNGMEAVKTFRRDRDIDLILMDILMPEMDGFEATKAIRKFDKDVPIIAQTAYNFDWNAIQKEGLGFNDYLSKPIGHYDLILKCYRYLES